MNEDQKKLLDNIHKQFEDEKLKKIDAGKFEEQIISKTNFSQIDPKVIFLGTGSMKPSKHRNVSSIFV